MVGWVTLDGDTGPDWQITGDLHAVLRAERSGKGSRPTYTITIQVGDEFNNKSTGQVTGVVPHDRGKGR